jgi:uncharacterized membrane protein YdbT with pleckstrin-like domain
MMAKTKAPSDLSAAPMKPLTSFAMHPKGIHFETQEEKETVILFLRQHMIVNIPWIVLAVGMVIAPTVIFPLVYRFWHLPVTLPVGYIVVATAWWYLATFGFVLAKFLGWFINIYIVTDERVVDIDFYYLLNKHFSQAELNKIQDISYVSKGLLSTFFNIGNVIIETAGEAPNLEFDKVPNPERIVETIRTMVEKHSHTL